MIASIIKRRTSLSKRRILLSTDEGLELIKTISPNIEVHFLDKMTQTSSVCDCILVPAEAFRGYQEYITSQENKKYSLENNFDVARELEASRKSILMNLQSRYRLPSEKIDQLKAQNSLSLNDQILEMLKQAEMTAPKLEKTKSILKLIDAAKNRVVIEPSQLTFILDGNDTGIDAVAFLNDLQSSKKKLVDCSRSIVRILSMPSYLVTNKDALNILEAQPASKRTWKSLF